MIPKKVTVIIPTWNSMPELKETLKSLPEAFGKHIKKIIFIDKCSTDGLVKFLYEEYRDYEWSIMFDTGTLGTARRLGLWASRTKWVAWIDSDIVLPKGWYKTMCKYIKSKKTGWVYGYTKENNEFVEKALEWKRQLKNNLPRKLRIGAFERAYTNNTICLRKPLLYAPIDNLNAWEDYVMGQSMIKQGYDVIEVPVACDHLKNEVYEKFGNYTEAWGIAGELKAKGFNPKTLGRPFYFLYWGIRCTVHFKDFRYTQYYTGVFISMIKSIITYLKKSKKTFEWSRNKCKN